ncbi:MAG: hypothetical protein ABFS42_10005 [Candidatus Krumholzibacteriota bacterium]
MISLLAVEIRQLWWLQLATLGAGIGVWGLLLAVTENVSTDAAPDGVIFNYMGSLLLTVFPVLLTGSGLMGGTLSGRAEFWLHLPVTRKAANLVRVLSLAVHVWPVLLTWPLIIFLLGRVYDPVAPWVIINSALAVGLGILLAARTRFAAFILYLFLPLQVALSHFVPGGKPFAIAWADNFASPWVGAALLVAGTGLAVFILNSHPKPRKT